MAEDINSIKEKAIMDIVTGSIYSLNFLKNITEAIFDLRLQSLSVGEVYEQYKGGRSLIIQLTLYLIVIISIICQGQLDWMLLTFYTM